MHADLRIKQAISTVQLYVQRCFLGLEKDKGVGPDVLDRGRWDWMQKYRVWEANRKVFLYPENWIVPSLRNDKSPFFKELESELQQKNLDKETIEEVLKDFVYKVDEVANLRVIGLFVDDESHLLHLFAQTRNSPFKFNHRVYSLLDGSWAPWDPVPIDIPTYDSRSSTLFSSTGTYVTPVVWNQPLFIFFPVMVEKQINNPPPSDTKFDDLRGKKVGDVTPTRCLEIRIAWSEYRNAKWSPKQISRDAMVLDGTGASGQQNLQLGEPSRYEFVPRLGDQDYLVIDVYADTIESRIISTPTTADPGHQTIVLENSAFKKATFTLQQTSMYLSSFGSSVKLPFVAQSYQYDANNEMHSLQATGTSDPTYRTTEPIVQDHESSSTLTKTHSATPIFISHSFSRLLVEASAKPSLDPLFQVFFDREQTPPADFDDAFGGDGMTPSSYNELNSSYAIYNWEAAYHVPMLLVDQLLTLQQFDQALKICQFVLDPSAAARPGVPDEKRFWKFPPFARADSRTSIEGLLLKLQANEPDNTVGQQINQWRKNPFQPRSSDSRPVAYMKYTAMKYIEILIAYGDYYFRQNTLETIPLAIQLYVLASHLFGPRGQNIPPRGTIRPETYNSLLDKWDAFSNAIVPLGLQFPFSEQIASPAKEDGSVAGLANIFGFATAHIFVSRTTLS